MIRFDFDGWQLRLRRDSQVQQYDNLTVPIVFYGEFPDDFTSWEMTIATGDNLDLILLTPMDGGMGANLTAQTLSVQGYYSVQLVARDGVRVRHSSVAQFYNPQSLSGDEQWPEIPTAFTEAVERAEAAAQSAAESEEAAEEAKQQWENMTAQAATLPSGSEATASYADGVLLLGIPQGADGQDGTPGQDGQDGYSPAVTVTEITGGHRVTVTDKTHQSGQNFDVLNGEDGAPGAPGQNGQDGITPTIGENGNWYLGDVDTGKPSRGVQGQQGAPGTPGYTPQKGVDYFTPSEVAAITNDAAEAAEAALEGMIPTQLSELTGDSTHRTVTDAEKQTWNSKQDAIPANTYDAYGAAAGVQTNLDAVTAKISDTASSTNKLVSASEMGDAIEAVEAKQLYATNAQGSFATKAALTSATTFYNADGTVATPTKNDVAYVLADESRDGLSAKYVIANEPTETLPPVWGFVIKFSDVTFTQAQMDALNSGVNSTKRAGYDAHVADSDIHVTAEQKQEWSGKYTKPSGGIPYGDMTDNVKGMIIKANSAVQPTDYATSTAGGVIKTGLGTGIGNQENEGRLIASLQTLAEYNAASNYSFVSKGVLNQLLNNKENKGKITISGVEKTANSHTVTIVTNGVTTNLTLVGVS